MSVLGNGDEFPFSQGGRIRFPLSRIRFPHFSIPKVRPVRNLQCLPENVSSHYSMPSKIQPIRTQDSRCIFDDITPSSLPIVCCTYVASTVLGMHSCIAYFTAWFSVNSYEMLSRSMPRDILHTEKKYK